MFAKKQIRSFKLILILACLLLLAVDIRAQKITGKQTNDAEDVRTALNKLVDGFNNRDAQVVVSSFTEDTYIINPTRGVGDYKGLSEGLAKAYAAPSKNPYTVLINVEEIQTSGDLAFVRLIWMRERNSDKQIISKEKDLEIWQRQMDGKWKLARGYSFYFKEDFPLISISSLTKSERVANKRGGKKPQSNQAKDIEAIKSNLDKLVASYNKRDLEMAMSLYAPDSLLSHEGVADSTREQARRAYAKRFANPPASPITISYQIEEIQTSGDLAFARLIWLVERDSDKKILSRNKDLEIWQRQKDGSWKLARGIGFYLKPDETAGNKTERLPEKADGAIQKSNDLKEKQMKNFLGLRTVIYQVENLEKAKEWYAKVLGVKPYFDQPFYVGFNVGGFELGLDPDATGVSKGSNAIAYWGVEDAEAAYKRMLELGAKSHGDVREVGGGIRVATVIDPFGNIFGIIENPNFKSGEEKRKTYKNKIKIEKRRNYV